MAFVSAATDPFWKYVTLLLHGNGTNGAQNNTFIDSSSNAFTVTRNGSTTQGSFSPFGPDWSANFNGTSSWIACDPNSAFNFSTNNFTIEGWVYLTTTPALATIIDTRSSDSLSAYFFGITSGLKLSLIYSSASTLVSTSSVSLNTWTHVAVTRTSGSIKFFINGTLDATTISYSSAIDATSFVSIGGGRSTVANSVTGYYLPGYISNFRISNTTSFYSASFTPSTVPLTAISGTSFLACKSNRFIDTSANNVFIGVYNSASIQRFSPFSMGSAYSTSVIGGGGYFNGSTDYLTVPANAALSMGTGDFTWEMWVYPLVAPSGLTGASNQLLFGYRSGSDLSPWLGFNSGSGGANPIILFTGDTTNFLSATFPALNSWNHIAITRSGTALKMFLNGAVVSSTTNSTNFSDASIRYVAAINNPSPSIIYYFPGYISNLRIVKGTAVYTAAFTPPTSPLTAITNTSLLLSTINGGIYDNAMMNNLTTAGTAQISTAQSKFGGASMYFNGTTGYLSEEANLAYDFGTGNFTVEMWANYLSATQPRFSSFISYGGNTNSGANRAGWSICLDANNNLIYVCVATIGYSWSFNPTSYGSNWFHLAVVRNNGSLQVYVNGTALGSAQSATGSASRDSNNYPLYIAQGTNLGSNQYFSGYIDDLRITKGYARYTANFTPPTAAFPNY